MSKRVGEPFPEKDISLKPTDEEIKPSGKLYELCNTGYEPYIRETKVVEEAEYVSVEDYWLVESENGVLKRKNEIYKKTLEIYANEDSWELHGWITAKDALKEADEVK